MSLPVGWRFGAVLSMLLLTAAVPVSIFLHAIHVIPGSIVMSLPTHTIMEFVGIQVCFSVFVVGWATHRHVRSADTMLLSLTCLVVGLFDLGHTLSFTGMPQFVTPSGPNKGIYFWLMGRTVCALGFLVVSLKPAGTWRRMWSRDAWTAVAIAWTAAWFLIIFNFEDRLPIMFVVGRGLTPLKISIEIVTALMLTAAGVMFLRRSVREPRSGFGWMGCATIILALNGVFFMAYGRFDDMFNVLGHLYRALAYILIYRAVYVECVSRPYREARQAARAANDANISKSRFLANVSHEFRTPLGVILGFGEMLEEQADLRGPARKWLGTISRNARQLNLLIDDLLDLAKVESQHIDVDLRTFAPEEAVGEVVSSLRLLAANKGIQIGYAVGVDPAYVLRSDLLRFNQILMNVIGNAVKFTPIGRVVVTLSPAPTGISVAVEDSGIGISAADARRLFQPFAQANDPQRRHFGGTGLGLALSKKLCRLLGGDLELTHSEPGRGSRFVVTIADQPDAAVRAAGPSPATAAPLTRVGDLSGVRILAAEDSEDNRELLDLYLTPTGAQLTFAHDGRQAVDAADDRVIDLILMDIQMPEMDGFEAVSALRQRGWTGPILALTAHAHPPERERAMRVGFDGYLVKPIVRETLIRTIAAYHHDHRPPV